MFTFFHSEQFRGWFRVIWVSLFSILGALLPLSFLFLQQASDLLLDRQGGGEEARDYWIWFVVAFTLYLMTLYTTARWAVMDHNWAVRHDERDKEIDATRFNELRERYVVATRWLPIIIPVTAGLLTTLSVFLTARRVPEGWVTDPDAIFLVPDHLWLGMLATAGPTVCFLIIALVASGVYPGSKRRRWPKFLPNLMAAGRTDDDERKGVAPAFNGWWKILLIGSTVCLILLAFSDVFASVISRAVLAMLLLTVWLPILTYASTLSFRWQFPVVTTFIVANAFVALAIGDNHQIHPVISQGVAGVAQNAEETLVRRRPSFDQWVHAWKVANGCANGEGPCPRPIVIAASGGASRAGFYTASALGKLMEASCGSGSEADCTAARENVVDQIFAMSAVSGSTLGTASFILALDQAERLGDRQFPCRTTFPEDSPHSSWKRGPVRFFNSFFAPSSRIETDAESALRTWRGAPDPPQAGVELVKDWQDCLELLTAGDYLSGTIGFMLSRDLFSSIWNLVDVPLPKALEGDRNEALARAMERHWSDVLRHPGDETATDKLASLRADGWLGLYADQIAYATNPKGDAPNWRPLMFSNGASVAEGNRIITSPVGDSREVILDSTDAHGLLNPFRHFPDAYEHDPCARAHDEVSQSAQNGADDEADGPQHRIADFTLAQSVTNSSRFPVVSTEGDFPIGPKVDENTRGCPRRTGIWPGFEKNLDQILDGGYFESVGVTTALDIANRLKVDHKLTPSILVITNDPTRVLREGRRRKDNKEEGVWGALETPVQGVTSVRSGGSRVSIIKMKSAFGEESVQVIELEPVKNAFGGCMEDLSMNWWLSHPVQEELRASLDNGENRQVINNFITQIMGSGAAETKSSASVDDAASKNATRCDPPHAEASADERTATRLPSN